MQKYSIFNAVRIIFFFPQPKCSTAFLSRWRSVDGNDDVCRSCDPSYREASQPSYVSISAEEPPFEMSHQSLTYNGPERDGTFDFKVGAPHRTTNTRHSNLRQPFAGLVKAGAGELNIPCLHTLNSAEEQMLCKLWVQEVSSLFARAL